MERSLTTKELKKKHSSRTVGRAEMGSWVERTHGKVVMAGGPGKVAAGGAGSSTFACRQTRRNKWGARHTAQPRVLVWGGKASRPLTVKTCGNCGRGETPILTGECDGETHRVLECTQNYLPGNQHQKGPICL